jgi:hypothetical protein
VLRYAPVSSAVVVAPPSTNAAAGSRRPPISSGRRPISTSSASPASRRALVNGADITPRGRDPRRHRDDRLNQPGRPRARDRRELAPMPEKAIVVVVLATLVRSRAGSQGTTGAASSTVSARRLREPRNLMERSDSGSWSRPA